MARGLLAAGVLLTVVLVVGCSAATRETSASGASALDGAGASAELDSILGVDRIARVLRAAPTTIPDNLPEFEAAFGVGRGCARSDSHEVWTIEEKQSRISGSQVETPNLLPRLVIGGCSQSASARGTFELMTAVVANPALDPNDPLPPTPVEVMALDETTGLFNFYVLEPSATKGGPGTVTRFVRRADDVVERWQKVAGKAATREESPDRKCYSCHVHGGPIMNELTEPWTNWVSSHKTLSRPLTGASRALVSESRPFSSEHTRSSLANQLEQVTRTAISTWVEGLPGLPGSGFGAQTMAGKQPGGAALLLRSVFCQTEVNFASAFDTVPVALFADASVANLAGLEPPVTPVSGAAFELVPVRAETDLRIERFLQKAGLLEPDTVLAVRLFDDMHDVFSEKRCAVHADATGRLPAKSLDAAVAAAILASLDTDEVIESNGDTSTTTHAQRVFIRALLDPTTPPAHRDEAESAYIVDITSRYAAETSKLNTKAGKAELQRRWRERQASARAMFPTAATPLPLMNAP